MSEGAGQRVGLRCRWVVAPVEGDGAGCFGGGLAVPLVVRRCLRLRGVRGEAGVEGFLQPRLRDLTDPFDFPGLAPMVERLHRARERRERMVVFGDYDVDGVTATAVLHRALGVLGWASDCHLPDRFDEGYGLTRESLARVVEGQGVGLVLAVDCGAGAADLIEEMGGRGVEVLVLDHHQPGASGLPRTPRLHPEDLAADHAARELCSAGLAFKLVHGLVKEGRRRGWRAEAAYDVRELLDLVALGTVADVVPLRGENRILVAAGLERLGCSRWAGLRALVQVSGVHPPWSVGHLGFQLAPRLNAAGRMETARPALDLLLAEDEAEATRLAALLDLRNRERQALEQEITGCVVQRVRSGFDADRDLVVVEGDDAWHLGVVGIVAARVMRAFHRPAIVLGGNGADWRGSGRSVPGFDLAEALAACSDLIVRGGGHALAAGLTVMRERVDALRARLNSLARDRLRSEQLVPELRLDGELALGEVDEGLVRWLQRLEPTGAGNAPASFVFTGLRCEQAPQRFGREGRHVRFRVTDGRVATDVVWWGGGEEVWPEGGFDLAAQPELNEFQGRVSVRLKHLDWRPSSK